jgi:hypothetical protein
MKRDRVAAGTVAVLAALALAACTAGQAPAVRRVIAGPVRESAATTPDNAITTERLDGALLRPADVPEGFEPRSEPDQVVHRTDPVSCGSILDYLQTDSDDDPGVLEARASLANADQSGSIQEVVRYFAGGSPRSQLSAAATALAGCPWATVSYPSSSPVTKETVSVHTATATALVARIVATTGPVVLVENLALQVVGAVLIILTQTAADPPDYAATAALVKRASRRLASVAG